MSGLLWLLRGVHTRLVDGFLTLEGRSMTRAGAGTRFLAPSRVLNPRRDRDLITIGRNCVVRAEIFCFAHGGKVRVGDDCFLGEGARIWSAASIRIGNRVLVSHGVDIHDTSGHPLAAAERAAHFAAIRRVGHPSDTAFDARPIVVEDDAWIGFRAALRPGITVGRGAIVGGLAVVTEDVPPHGVVVGNPARLVRVLEPHER